MLRLPAEALAKAGKPADLSAEARRAKAEGGIATCPRNRTAANRFWESSTHVKPIPQDQWGPEERYLVQRYGDNVVGLLKYGSMAFGVPHRHSVHDFWVIVRDLHAFHAANADFYRTRLNVVSSVEDQIAANRIAPNFYALEENGLRMKLAVLSEHDFARLCKAKMMFVKGRMQKPLRAIRITAAVQHGIDAARIEGASHAVNLCPERFTFEQFLYQLCSLSYRAEIRPERKRAKIQSIIDKGRTELGRIYRPLLARMPHIHANGNGYRDVRSADQKRLARTRTMGYLRRCRWSAMTLRLIWRNYRTHSTPIRYIIEKIIGEIEKGLHRHRERQRNRTARRPGAHAQP